VSKPIIIALAKGKVCVESLTFLKALDIYPTIDLDSRKLLIDTNNPNFKLIVVRSSDVPVYVRHGVVDFGIVGKDVLLEQVRYGYYEIVDLKFAACKLMLATLENKTQWQQQHYLTVATKFDQTAARWFAKQGKQVEIIHLNGAIELAATSGLSYAIVDLVSTGKTLKANGLVGLETIAEISSRLIVNEQAYKYRTTAMKEFIAQCQQQETFCKGLNK
jgi:ATP phosphoribosyltransferase